MTRPTLARAAVALLLLSGVAAPASAAELTIKTERAQHPHMARALDHMYAAMREMEAAPDDFGGNKGNAMEELRRATHAAKKALYYRLKMDDRALESAR